MEQVCALAQFSSHSYSTVRQFQRTLSISDRIWAGMGGLNTVCPDFPSAFCICNFCTTKIVFKLFENLEPVKSEIVSLCSVIRTMSGIENNRVLHDFNIVPRASLQCNSW